MIQTIIIIYYNYNYNVLLDVITKSMNACLQKKIVKFNKKKHKKDPCIPHGILRSVNRKHYLYKPLKKKILKLNILKRGEMFSIPIETI